MNLRVVLDTNVLISGLLGGASTPVLQHWRRGGFILVLSSAIYAEYHAVLLRPKFKLPPALIADLLAFIRERAEWIEPIHTHQIARDPADDKFLDVAIAGQIDYLISADQDLLVLEAIAGIPIISPWDFVSKLG